MELVKVTAENIEEAASIQRELFPDENGRANFEASLMEGSRFSYALIYEEGVPAGIIGIYEYPEDHESAWLGWFGIRESFRRRHLGTEAIRRFEAEAAARGYRYARLYTDANDNDAAIAFYRKNGYVSEPYVNPDDPACMEYPMLIFSRSLTSDPLVPWNSRNIHLTEQIALQNSGNNQQEE